MVPLLLVSTLAVAPPATAQQGPVFELFRITWTEGVEAALDRYAALPGDARSPSVLIGLADQLLWTGRSAEAVEVLSMAELGAPHLAEVAFQQGRAHLQRGEIVAALRAFERGVSTVDLDATLSEDERSSLGRRLENRVWLLTRADDLLARMGAYRTAEGATLVFRFDPYLNTFPSLVDVGTGETRILFPGSDGRLEWRAEGGAREGAVSFDGDPGNAGLMVVETPEGIVRLEGAGIRRETLRFRAGKAHIEGTLFRPAEDSPVPAVVLTHGAGLSSRYNLATEALAYAASGVAAFVYDKPGLGRSTGGNWLLLSIPEQAGHVHAAVERLRTRPAIGEVGVWGFSQGGWVAPLVAGRSDVVAFVVLASGAAVSPQEQSLQAMMLGMEAAGVPDGQRREAEAYARALWARVNAGTPLDRFADLHARADSAIWGSRVPRMRMEFELAWWRENEVDAGAALEALVVPVLAIFGELDTAVPPRDNVPLMASHLATAGTGDYTLVVLPGADHQLMTGDGYHPSYFGTMIGWVTARFGATGRR